MKLYDTVIIGSGPGGLSAAIYLGRFMRKVLVIDSQHGRSTYPQINENYLGFPKGISVRKLRNLGKEQAEQFGVEFVDDTVETAKKEKGIFHLKGKKEYIGKTVIFATGVRDYFPMFTDMPQCVGKSLFWCITCDGHKVRQKSIMVVGNSDDSVVTALQFTIYTKKIVFVTNCTDKECLISRAKINRLEKAGIPFYHNQIVKVKDKRGYIDSVELDDGKKLKIDYMFSQQGATANSEVAVQLGVVTGKQGYIVIDSEQRTNIPHVYAAGDVTKLFSHQVITAAHEGSMAAQAANYDLYEPEQRD